ncbi:ATP-dependent Clp protease proteolytic subunit [Candidatus Vidania fulgoroideae]|nr:ATP-dependent Clp protease proteolytic subunit [Candidatus Vidania fulgoroideae]
MRNYGYLNNVEIKLLESRIIFLTGYIDENLSNSLVVQLLYLDSINKNDISVYINSPGGEINSGLAIYDTMNYVSSNISTLCIGLAASMAAFLLSSGQKGKRYSLPNSRIMIHQPLGGAKGQASDIKIQTKEILYLKKKIINILSSNTSKKKKIIEKDTDRDNFMSPEEALKYGIIDKIIKNE